MAAWVSAAVRPAPRDRTVSVRFGSTIYFAGWSLWHCQWFAVEPGGRQTDIADPPLWFDRDAQDQSIEDERRLVFGPETTSAKPLRGARQLDFCLEPDDSGKLSHAATEVFSPGRLV